MQGNLVTKCRKVKIKNRSKQLKVSFCHQAKGLQPYNHSNKNPVQRYALVQKLAFCPPFKSSIFTLVNADWVGGGVLFFDFFLKTRCFSVADTRGHVGQVQASDGIRKSTEDGRDKIKNAKKGSKSHKN